jgi:hypothetical protein
VNFKASALSDAGAAPEMITMTDLIVLTSYALLIFDAS